MAKNDDVDQTDLGVPSADIPDLKKKEKERKRSGAAWSGARAPGGTFQGATGGAGRAAASAASSAAGGVQAGVGLVAKFAALSLMGKMAAFAGTVVMLGGAGLVGSALLGGGSSAPGGGMGSPSLGGITSSVKVHSGGRDRIGVDSKGEIAFDPVAKPKPAEKKVEEPAPAAETAATDTSAADMAKEALGAKDTLAHNLSGAQLSGSLGGQFGGKNIFTGSGGAAPKFGANTAKFNPKGGRMAAMRPGSVKATAGARSTSKGRASRSALSQLRVAQRQSIGGAGATTSEAAQAGALNAFEQNAGDPGTLTAPGSPTRGTVAPLSGGSGGADGTGTVTVPNTLPFDAVQAQIDAIKNMVKQAQEMKKSGITLIIIGTIVAIVGYVLIDIVWTAAVGACLVILGLGLIYSGYSKIKAAEDLAEKAKQMGTELAKRTGEFQSKIVKECVEQAIANLTSIEACKSVEAEERARQAEEQRKRDLERQKEIGADDPPAP